MEGKLFCTERRGWILSEFDCVISVVITTYSRDYHSGIHGRARGRKSLARARGRVWLGLYNVRSKLNTRFWRNIKRLIDLVGEGSPGARAAMSDVVSGGSDLTVAAATI